MRFVLAAIALFAGCSRPVPRVIAIRGAAVIDGGEAKPAVVIVRGNKIEAVGETAAIPPGAEIVDASGKFITPGLMDLHVHLGSTGGAGFVPGHYTRERVTKNLNAYLYFGVTTVRSVGTERQAGLDLRDQQRCGDVTTARLFTAGRGFTAPGGHPSQEIGDIARQPSSTDDARAQVRELASPKVDLIKIWIDGRKGQSPKISRPVIEAILDEARQFKIPVHAHIHSLEDTKHFFDHGGAGFLHMVRDSAEFDEQFVKAIVDRRAVFTPTLIRQELAWYYKDANRFDDPGIARIATPETIAGMRKAAAEAAEASPLAREEFQLALANSKKLAGRGVAIAVGSDGGSQMDLAGLMTHREIELLVEGGFTPAEALAAATRNGALALNKSAELGAIAKDRLADLLVLDANPLDDVRNLRKISRLMLDGRWIDREALALR